MDLEQRVKLLEQEVEILKNQIQATLLDIQTHLLTNAYPSLRAEEDPTQSVSDHSTQSAQSPVLVRVASQPYLAEDAETPSYDQPLVRRVSPSNGRGQQNNDTTASVSARPVKSVKISSSQPSDQDDEDDEPAQPPERPAMRKGASNHNQNGAKSARRQPSDQDDEDDEPAQPPERPAMRKGSSNHNQSAAKSARQQPPDQDVPDDGDEPAPAFERPATRKVSPNNNQSAAKSARQQPPDQDEPVAERRTWDRQPGLSKAAEPAAQAALSAPTTPDNGMPPSRRPSKAQLPFDEAHINMEAWIRNRVEQIGVNRTWELIQAYEQKGRITPDIKETLMQYLAVYAPADDPADQPDSGADTQEPGSSSQRLVLRLIAGVQNAGAGIGRRKR